MILQKNNVNGKKTKNNSKPRILPKQKERRKSLTTAPKSMQHNEVESHLYQSRNALQKKKELQIALNFNNGKSRRQLVG